MADKYKDYQLDENLKQGCVQNRSCQDVLCCLVFLLSCVALVIIAVVGYANGDPKRLLTPYDAAGNACGEDTHEDYKYIYFVTPVPGYLDRTLCLKECPYISSDDQIQESKDAQDTSLEQKTRELDCALPDNTKEALQISTCQENKSLYSFDAQIFESNSWKVKPKLSAGIDDSLSQSVFYYSSKPFLGRICLPKIESLAGYVDFIKKYLDDAIDVFEKWFGDLKVTWPVVAGAPIVAVIICLLFMFLMRYCVGLITWFMIFLYFILLFLLAQFIWNKAQDQKDESDSSDDSVTSLKVLAYFLYAFLGISVIIFICFYTKIQLAIAVLKCATVYMRDNTSAILVPIVNTLIVIVFWAVWISSFIFLFSYGEISASDHHPFGTVKWKDDTRYMIIYFIFGGLWKNAFISAFCQFVLCSSVVIWYYGGDQGAHGAIRRSIYRGFRYHLGSIAFGSLILAIVQFIRLILLYVEQMVKKHGGAENKFVRCIIWCSQCYLGCLERFIRFLNRQAYIQIAISGKSFCSAAKEAFCIIMKNGARFVVVSGLGQIFISIGKLIIAVATAFLAYLVLTKVDHFDDDISSPFFTTILVGIIGLIVGMLFLSIYGMAVDAILHCFIQDETLAQQDPAFKPNTRPELKDFITDFEKRAKRARALQEKQDEENK